MRLIMIILMLSVIHVKCKANDMEVVAKIESTESAFWRLSVAIDNDNAYLCGAISVDDEYYLKGMIAQIDRGSESVAWEKKIEDTDKTIIPHIIRVNDNSEIELLSELSLLRSNFTYGNQIVNIRKYKKNGELISNYSDSSNYEKATQANFPIGYDYGYDGISVYYTPKTNHTMAYSYAVHLNKSGEYQSISILDSSTVITKDSVDRYLIKGFESFVSGVYVYGLKHIKRGNDEVIASYVMKLNNSDNILWKESIEPDNGYFTIRDICVTPEEAVYVVGFKGDDHGMIRKLNKNGEVEWSKVLGDYYFTTPMKIIPNLSGDFIIVGKAKDYNNAAAEYRYIAKIDSSGKILWQEKILSQSLETLTDVVEYENNKYYISSIRGTSALLYKFEDPDVSVEEQNTAPEVNVLEYAEYYYIENNKLYDKAELVSIRGKVLKSIDISEEFNFQVEKDNYYRGVFFLRLSGKKGTLVKKLIY